MRNLKTAIVIVPCFTILGVAFVTNFLGLEMVTESLCDVAI